jgi:hypothetical protein
MSHIQTQYVLRQYVCFVRSSTCMVRHEPGFGYYQMHETQTPGQESQLSILKASLWSLQHQHRLSFWDSSCCLKSSLSGELFCFFLFVPLQSQRIACELLGTTHCRSCWDKQPLASTMPHPSGQNVLMPHTVNVIPLRRSCLAAFHLTRLAWLLFSPCWTWMTDSSPYPHCKNWQLQSLSAGC